MIELCADFETTSQYQFDQEGETRVYLWGCMPIDNNGFEYGISIDSFMQYLVELKDDILCYFHNLSFDGEFILWSLLRNGYTPTYNEDLIDGEFTHITTDMGSIYKIQFKNETQTITFQCSYKLIPVSIKDLGRLVGIDKLDETYDYNAIRNYNSKSDVEKETLDYLHNDIQIMKQAIITAKSQGLTSLTIASSAYKNWLNTQFAFEKKCCQKPQNQLANDLINKSYRGGITYCNPSISNKFQYGLVSYDVNSLYPSVMLANCMPYGEPKFVDKQGSAKFLHLYHIVICSVKIDKGYHPFIPTKSSRLGSYEYEKHIDGLAVCLWEDEFSLFKRYYSGDYEVINILQFRKKKNVFKRYFSYWKNIKETTDNPVEKQVAKLMMNSLYGKFGTNDDKMSRQITMFNDETIGYTLEPSELTKYYYRAIASYITSCARCVLIRAIEDNADRFLYCDTDSIYLKGTQIPNLPIDDKLLGYWGYEGMYPKALFIKAKCYMKTLENGKIETRVAGLPKKAQYLLNYDNFKIGTTLKGVKLQHKRVKGGVVLIETDFTITG